MARPASEHPTELEHQILKILWDESPLPVRDIRRRLAERGRALAHTSVITTLNIMVRKKSLTRTRQKNAFLVEPRVSREDVSRRMLGDLVDRVFDGSAAAVVLSLFERSEIDADELKELRGIIRRKSSSLNAGSDA
jgi:BlaI family transcriptional regulator, penicillinase repressor